MLGMCPTLAVTTSAINGIGMGLSTTAVLIMSNMMISMLRKIIPDSVRMPAFIVVVASFVTIVQFLLEGFVPSLYDSLGLYIPLIVVNCIILGRAESYASKNPVIPSIFDGIGMGLGFTVGLTSIGIVRELIGSGKIFNMQILPDSYEPFTIFILAPGAFFVLACLVALQNKVKNNLARKGKKYRKQQDAVPVVLLVEMQRHAVDMRLRRRQKLLQEKTSKGGDILNESITRLIIDRRRFSICQ